VPAILAFAVLIGLGVWQIERKAWKEGLIASLTERLAAPAIVLAGGKRLVAIGPSRRRIPPRQNSPPYSTIAAKLWFFAAASAFRPDVADLGPGYWVFTPARLSDGAS